MSQKIDPDSVHLGGESKEYYAEYVPVPKSDQPEACALPESTPLNLTAAPLLALNEACSFTFPSVLALPPVYNPPQVKFLACETLTANTDITTCPAAAGSRLTLIASGPTASEEKDGAASCSLTLAGNICVEACEDFTTNYSVNFPAAMRGSSLTLTSRSIPNCGLDLAADFALKVCEDFEVTSNIAYTHATKTSKLALTPRKAPNCGLDISGVIDAIACETFDASANITVSGLPGVVSKSNWKLSKTKTPDCSFQLDGDVFINACKDFDADGTITVSGNGVAKSSGIKLVPKKAPNCGVTLAGNIDVTACKEFTVNGGINISGKPVSGAITVTSTGAPNCSLNIGGGVTIKACDEITSAGSVTVTASRGGGSGNISLTKAGDCGMSLTGGISISACNLVTAGGSVAVTSKRGEATGIVQLVSGGDGCGVDLVGSIDVNACDQLKLTANAPQTRNVIYTSNNGRNLGNSYITPTLTINALDDCSAQVDLEVFTVENVTLNTDMVVNEDPLRVVSGCTFDASTDSPHLVYIAETNSLRMDGCLSTMHFTCDEGDCNGSPFVKSSIELSALQVDNITTSSCCGTASSLNLCGGSLYLDGDGPYTSITPGNVSGYGGDGPGFEISSGYCNIYGSEGNTSIYPGIIEASDSTSSFVVGSGQLSLEGSGASFTVGYGSLSMSGQGGSLSINPGRDMFVTSIQVCVGDEIKSMDVIGSGLY